MRELGDASRQAHYDIGALIAELAIDCVGVVGEFKKDVAKGAVDHGFPEDRLFLFDDKKAAARWIHGLVDGKKLGEDDVLLVKASRGLRFETIVDEIIH
jgi:UDP-N-acetylmuramyl pentapeptide synthase